MRGEGGTVLLGVTRLISRSWTGRHSTGIDRVCYAYLRHYRARALAVVQHRGLVRVFDVRQSARLIDLLLGDDRGFRAKLMAFAPGALASPVPEARLAGLPYLNVSHTDFDLAAHHAWAVRCGVRSFHLIHDLIPILHPEFSRPHAVGRHLGRVRGALREADGIFVTSHTVAGELAGFAQRDGLPLPKLTVAPIAGAAFARNDRAAVPGAKPYFLSVGTIEPRKNHRLLFDVWRALQGRMGEATPRLVLVGQKGPLTGDILDGALGDPALSAHIEWLAHCPDAQLGALIAGARALLMPSLAEGFGLPLVEALQLGTPAIASNSAIFREVGQGTARLLDPSDCGAWVDAVAAMSGQEASGTAVSDRFTAPTWTAHFAKIDAAIAPRSLKSAAACETSLAA